MADAEVTMAAAAARQKIEAIFRGWDVGGHGWIGVEELRAALGNLGVPANTAQLIFEVADANGDGRIDFDEFLAWICGSGQHARDVRERLENPRVFAAFGVDASSVPWNNRTGGITDEELARVRAEIRSQPGAIVRRTFEALYLILNAADVPSPRKPPQWVQVARMLRHPDFGDRLRSFDMAALRDAPGLTAYLVREYFGPGGAAPPERLAGGQETLTVRRVRRASRTAAVLFQWSYREMIDVGALQPPPEEAEEAEPPPPEPDPEEVARQQRNREAPPLSGDLAALPARDSMVEPHQVLFQLMNGASAEATALAEKLGSAGPCDRCDSAHHALDCPHFGPHKGHKAWTPRSRGREDHADAWIGLGGGQADEAASQAGALVIGRQVQQPGDGTCLYHSLSYGLRGAGLADAGFTGHDLRREIADWCETNADEEVAGSAFRDYIWWDHTMTVEAYCDRMRDGGAMVWGGAIEIAACIRMYEVNVHVYVPEADPNNHGRECFRRIAAFGDDGARPTVAVTYMMRCHYDALVL